MKPVNELIADGDSCYLQESYSQAIFCYVKAIEAGSSQVYMQLGCCYQKIKRYHLAITAFKKAIKTGNTRAYEYAGDCYAHIKDNQQAILYHQKALETGYARHSWVVLGICHQRIGSYRKAIVYYKKAIENGDYHGYIPLVMMYARGKGIKKTRVRPIV